jgi:hypothetical protein
MKLTKRETQILDYIRGQADALQREAYERKHISHERKLQYQRMALRFLGLAREIERGAHRQFVSY